MRGAFAMGLQEVKDCVQNQIRSFIILDLETTSLPDDRPVKITEIAMVAAMREHILGYGDATSEVTTLPRALSKLTICVHPRRVISGPASDITRTLNLNLQFTSLIKVRLGLIFVFVVWLLARHAGIFFCEKELDISHLIAVSLKRVLNN
jgi:hypothetical protein